jgi:hypothetical protein
MEFSENLAKFNRDRIEVKRRRREEMMKEREKWSFSVLQKHKKQWDQVL